MNLLLSILLLIGSGSAIATNFKPHYEEFAHGHMVLDEFKVKQKMNGRKEIIIYLEGTVASCSSELFTFAPSLLIKRKLKIISCNENELKVNALYWRKAPCDQALEVNSLKFKVILPKDCDFSVKDGAVVIDRS